MLPLHLNDQHRALAQQLYRVLLRNALHLPSGNGKDVRQLVLRIRTRTRSQRSQTNGYIIQQCIKDGIELNDRILEAYDTGTIGTQLGLFINKNHFSGLTEKGETPLHVKKIKPHLVPYKIFLKTQELRPYKSKHDKKYVDDLLHSTIKYSQQESYLTKLEKKLSKEATTARLHRINGTSKHLYMIKTPWNKDLKFQSGKWISQIRIKYDNCVTEMNQLTLHKSQFGKMCQDEDLWDQKMNFRGDSDGATWLNGIETAERILKKDLHEINKQVDQFNNTQWLYMQKLGKEFDESHRKSKSNLQRLLKIKEELQIGAFTDIIPEMNLGKLLVEHQFRDPTNIERLTHSDYSEK